MTFYSVDDIMKAWKYIYHSKRKFAPSAGAGVYVRTGKRAGTGERNEDYDDLH
ncbi:MAG: hypothetical protein J6X60_13090 [Ruminiclostridium sp.]|nr:hypothetical protein [Ruminiclostridium sp.]